MDWAKDCISNFLCISFPSMFFRVFLDSSHMSTWPRTTRITGESLKVLLNESLARRLVHAYQHLSSPERITDFFKSLSRAYHGFGQEKTRVPS